LRGEASEDEDLDRVILTSAREVATIRWAERKAEVELAKRKELALCATCQRREPSRPCDRELCDGGA
jgi:hypothetical protein